MCKTLIDHTLQYGKNGLRPGEQPQQTLSGHKRVAS